LKAVADAGGGCITPDDPEYPPRLLEIYDPPAVLWTRGDTSILPLSGIAVVGTRSPSTYGSGMAEMLSRDLSQRGLTILSGMARGVDTAAHKGAIQARGKTVAVWGTGIDVIYPKENKRLAPALPAPQNFPVRNRILSGMSVGVLVIEAAEYSGTRITARCALEQGREVYAVPGNVTNKNAWGPNTLIKQGAKLTATWEDVWEDLPSQIRIQLEDRLAAARESKPGAAASLKPGGETLFAEPQLMPEHERLVLEQLRMDETTQLDELMERLEPVLGSAEVFTALFELELSGKVRQMPGKNYVRTF
jgi:DNA processing protein